MKLLYLMTPRTAALKKQQEQYYTFMVLVVGRYEGLFTQRRHISRGACDSGIHIYFPGARGLGIHEVFSS